MPLKILLGTRNRGKIHEITQLLGSHTHIRWLTFDEVPFSDVVEDGQTFQDNAVKKAHEISNETGLAVLAEDSGLEVTALEGAPGIQTARYAGKNSTSDENINKLLDALSGNQNRHARFACFSVLFVPGNPSRQWISEGFLEGEVAHEPRGKRGFGYDPVFIPKGYAKTLAELGEEVKNKISHRTQAMAGLGKILSELSKSPK